jgi:hypothetical protein
MFQPPHARFAMTPPRVPATLTGAPRRSGGCPRDARSQPSRGPALRSGWLSAPFASIGGRRSPLQARHRLRGRAQGACHARRLRAPASGSRRNPLGFG